MKYLLLIPLALLPLACKGESKPLATAQEAPSQADTPLQSGPIEGDYTVECGCQIKGIDACGNYVHVGDHVYAIEGDLGIDKHMEWCGQGQKTAHIKGTLEGHTCQATALTVKP
ncbi:MAG: hypothetical protein H6830_05915 [Planctomycetes bacterium]|nr:hypothetical protein [Planctomycetota bacterium]MCB9909059.1 hypothetical protein [Planctomycetota bacterium]MCB9911694.1 hypothetical protein [Planctomycetota bacterium]HPF13215.1 hypothetical protein [Planctomycetota bacterium]HRV80725.1 hypothetical protein [Planctomycetota bacterium]